jgi:hypothetical protein
MVEISSSGSGEGPGWATAPGYSTDEEHLEPNRRDGEEVQRHPLEFSGGTDG